jgi:hypothetical protein
MCPPGYTVSSDYGCVAPSGGDYTESGPGYDYWPDYGFGYPFGGFPGFGHGAGHPQRFARFHGGRGFHGRAGLHGAVKFGGFGTAAARSTGFGRR